MAGISRHCPTYGGARAEKREADSGSKGAVVASVASAGKQPGPEIDQAEAVRLVQKAAQGFMAAMSVLLAVVAAAVGVFRRR